MWDPHAPLNESVALSPTFVLVWNEAVRPGSKSGVKSHCPRYAIASSGTGSVRAVAELVGDDVGVPLLDVLVGIELYVNGQYPSRRAVFAAKHEGLSR